MPDSRGITSGIGLLIVPHLFSMQLPAILKRAIPATSELIPTIGLGTWASFDAGSDSAKRNTLKDVLNTLVKSGGNVVDSSPMYGTSESVVGDLLTDLNIRNSLFLATKVWTNGEQQGIDQMNRSFTRMKTSVMDLMQVHNLVDVQTHMNTLRKWKEQGKIRYTGITHYTASAYSSVMQLIKTEKPDFVQFNYNISVREAEQYLLPLAKDQGVAVIINRPFEEGNLFQIVKGKSLPGWAGECDINSWGQFFLKFILSHPAVTCIIPGTSNVKHIQDNLQAGFGKLPDAGGRKKMVEYFTSL